MLYTVLTIILSEVISAAILKEVKYIVLGVNVLIYNISPYLTSDYNILLTHVMYLQPRAAGAVWCL